jgi:hypothetical protein
VEKQVLDIIRKFLVLIKIIRKNIFTKKIDGGKFKQKRLVTKLRVTKSATTLKCIFEH